MNDDQIVQAVIKRYGAVIDLRENPSAIIDIIRRFRFGADDPDGGLPPGGAPKPPPPDPSSMGSIVQLDDVMRVLLKLSRDIARLGVQGKTVTARSAKRVAPKRKAARKRR
jgi:hypothetical protein